MGHVLVLTFQYFIFLLSTPSFRAQGSKTQLPQLDILEDEVRIDDQMNDCMQELSLDETEKIDHEELRTGNSKFILNALINT